MAGKPRQSGALRALGDAFARLREKKSSPSRRLIALSNLARPVWPTGNAARRAREGFERNAVAYRCVRLIAESAAALPLIVERDGKSAPDHPLAVLLCKPNPEETGQELFETILGHLQIAGDAYVELVEIDGVPKALYALRPDRMQVVPGPKGWPLAWEYRADGRMLRYPVDQDTGRSPILHLKLFHPFDDHYGLSPLQAASFAIDIHNEGGAWNKALIENAARPSGALVYNAGENGARLTDDQFERLKSELESLQQGPRNAGRPLLLEGGLDWRPMSLSPADMDFIEARREAAREIALAFGVPPMLLGIPGDNTYSNYREANQAFARQVTAPLAQKLARSLSNWLGDRFEQSASVRCDYDRAGVLSEERQMLWARAEAATFLNDDEKRALVGLPPQDKSLGSKDTA